MQPTFVGSLGSESVRGVNTIPSASVDGALPMNPSYGFQGSSRVQSASMGMDRAMGRKWSMRGEWSIKIPAPPQQGFSTTIHGFDGMEIDNDSADFSYMTDRDIGGDRDMGVPTSAFDSESSSGRRSHDDNVPIPYSEGSIPKARTLGGDRTRRDGQREVRETLSNAILPPPLTGSGLDLQGQTQTLPPPSLKTFLEARVEETGDTLEVRDSEVHGGTSLFLSFVQKPKLFRIYVEICEVTFFTSKEKTVQ